jgi:hypothetical protein
VYLVPEDWLGYPRISDGVAGVRFIDASVRSNSENGDWTAI